MASDEREKKIDKSLSWGQMFKAGFAGDASAQMAAKERMMKENEAALSNQNALTDALKKRTKGQ